MPRNELLWMSSLVAVVFVSASGASGVDNPERPLENPGSPTDQPTVVGRNCRADVIDAQSSLYLSRYFDVMSDGSERVTAEVQTEAPCP